MSRVPNVNATLRERVRQQEAQKAALARQVEDLMIEAGALERRLTQQEIERREAIVLAAIVVVGLIALALRYAA